MRFEPGSLVQEIGAPADGLVVSVENLQMAHIGCFAGAPMDKGAGVDLLKKLGDPVRKGEPLYRVHAEFRSDFDFALSLCERDIGYCIGAEEEVPRAFVEF
jgi:thymidine phosphorylase